MNAAVMRRAFEVFDRVRDAPPVERDLLIDSDESISDEIRSAVRDLLKHDSPTGEFLGMSLGDAAATLTRPLREAALPERVGRYRILKEIGRGGFGRVYLAEQESPKRQVAVKVLRVGFSRTDARRLIFEAEALARLDHPGIAHVYESGTCDDSEASPFIAMEYVEGIALDRYAAEHGSDRHDRLRILEEVAEALEHAHQRGVLHRDLAPRNILVDSRGQARLIDFGLAHGLQRGPLSQTMTVDGAVLGTLRSMSPEQLNGNGRAVDTRSDVFSLGVVAFELLAGAHPFMADGDEVGPAIRKQLEAPVRRPAAIDASLRGDFEAVLLKSVEREPSRRYQSASAFAADMRALRLGEPVAARSYSASARVASFCRRHRTAVGLAAVTALLLAGAGVSMGLTLRNEAVARDSAVNALDAIVTHVIAPLSPRVGTLEERERLLTVIAPEIESMFRRTPGDPRVARIAGAYFGAVGDVQRERERNVEAVASFDRSLAAYERARALGDESLPVAHALSIICVKRGNAFESLGESVKAQEAYRLALSLDTSLAVQHPEDIRVLSNLFWSHWRLAGWPLSEMHGTEADDAAAVMEKMRAIAPNDWRTLEAVTRVMTRRAIERGVFGDLQEARLAAEQSLGAARALLETDPSSAVFLKAQIQAACAAAGAALDQDDTSAARARLDEASRAVAIVEPTIHEAGPQLFFVSILNDARARLALRDRDPARALRHAEALLGAYEKFCPMGTLSADLAIGRLRMLEVRAIAREAIGPPIETADANKAIIEEAKIFGGSIHCTPAVRDAAARYRDRALERLNTQAAPHR